MSKLRLGPLPKTELVRLSIALPSSVKADLDRYAELYGATYGKSVDAAALAPHMLAAFMARDREFRRIRQGGEVEKSPPTDLATAIAAERASEALPSR